MHFPLLYNWLCQTSAHHWGHTDDLLSYCLPVVAHALESSVGSVEAKIKRITTAVPLQTGSGKIKKL